MIKLFTLLFCFCFTVNMLYCQKIQKNNDPIVILGFDDAEVSQYNIVAPLLKKYQFGATFFVCEFPLKSPGDTSYYMKWAEIKALWQMGFEIGNHTGHHKNMTKMTPEQAKAEVKYIEEKCALSGIPKPISFAYPGNRDDSTAQVILKEMGYHYARTGGSIYYDPTQQPRLAIPSYTMGASDKLKERTWGALKNIKPGQILAFTIHGVPDTLHPDYTTSPELLAEFFEYMKIHHYKVIAMRDLDKYIGKN